jgi:hypothetical protein
MTYQEFWCSLLSNFLATLVAGTLIGAFLVNWITKKENQKEKKIEKIQKEIEKAEKSKKYLEIISSEIQEIINYVEIILDKNNQSGPTDYIFINTDYWEILKTGGEIPLLFQPIIIKILSIFYSNANEINSLENRRLLLHQSIHNATDEEKINKRIKEELQKILNMRDSKAFLESISQSIEIEKNKIESLNSQIK